MRISELKEKISSPMDKRTAFIVIAKSANINYPELRDNNELQNLIKQRDPILFERFTAYWSDYINLFYFIKNLLEHTKHDELNANEMERLEIHKNQKEKSFSLLVEELDKRKAKVIL